MVAPEPATTRVLLESLMLSESRKHDYRNGITSLLIAMVIMLDARLHSFAETEDQVTPHLLAHGPSECTDIIKCFRNFEASKST